MGNREKQILIILFIKLSLITLGFAQNEPCYQRIGVEGGGFGWTYANNEVPNNSVVEENFTQPATNAGFTLDIYELDNSFNMEINGVLLATKEIELRNL